MATRYEDRHLDYFVGSGVSRKPYNTNKYVPRAPANQYRVETTHDPATAGMDQMGTEYYITKGVPRTPTQVQQQWGGLVMRDSLRFYKDA